MRSITGFERMYKTFWGFEEIARQDELHVMKKFGQFTTLTK